MNHTIYNCDILIPQDIFEFSLDVTEGFRYLNVLFKFLDAVLFNAL